MNKLGNIKISGQSSAQAIVEIEGVIGLPEEWQFEDQQDRVATYEKFREVVEQIKALKTPQVRVNIRSIGGSVEDALLIYEALCLLDAQVTTYCHGYVASAATIIAQAGAMRYISSGAMYLIHNSVTSIDGNKQEALRTADILGKTDGRIARIYADRSGCGVEVFEELMGRDGGRGEWLSPEETVELGLADQVVEFSVIKNVGQKIRNFARSLRSEFTQLVDKIAQLELDEASAQSNSSAPTIDNKQAESQDDSSDDAMAQEAQREEKIQELRRQVTQTTTEPREDPALESPRQSQNQGAYANDVEVFRTTIV